MKKIIKNKVVLFFKIILSALVISWAVFFLIFNLWFLPNGYHLAAGVRIAPSDEKMNIFTVGTTRWTSFMLAKYANNKCDAATFQHGVLMSGKNQALNTLIFLYNEPHVDNNSVLELFSDRLHLCDVDNSGERNEVLDRIIPLQESIILKHPALVKLLLAAGARTDLRMPIRGKRTDNMNAIELATFFMQSKKLNDSDSRVANEVYLLIKKHEDVKEEDVSVAEKKLR